jgi:hypothetical protein
MTCHGAFNGCCAALPPSSRVETAVQTITGATASLALPQRRAKVACQFTSTLLAAHFSLREGPASTARWVGRCGWVSGGASAGG